MKEVHTAGMLRTTIIHRLQSCIMKGTVNLFFINSGPEKGRFVTERVSRNLSTFATNTTNKLDVFGHDGDSLGVDGTQVGVFEKTHQVSLASLLQSHDGRALETQVGLEILGDFSDQTLEWQLADQKLS